MANAYPTAFELMKKYGIEPKKSFGQNFLISDRAFRGIVDATCQDDDDVVIEFGAGVGTLTSRLSARVPEGLVVAVERERAMLEILNGELSQYDNVQIESADALTFDIEGIARWQGRPVTVCGNLPYNIASQILIRLTTPSTRAVVTRGVFLIQKEMADRLLADPGTRAYGPLGVLITAHFDVSKVLNVAPTCFVPAPKVQSTAVLLSPRTQAWTADEGWFRKVVHAALGHRRKTLRNSLKQTFAIEHIDAALATCGVDGAVRGDTLDVDAIASLSEALRRHDPPT